MNPPHQPQVKVFRTSPEQNTEGHCESKSAPRQKKMREREEGRKGGLGVKVSSTIN